MYPIGSNEAYTIRAREHDVLSSDDRASIRRCIGRTQRYAARICRNLI